MDINLKTKFNIGDRVGFNYFSQIIKFGILEWEEQMHLSPKYDYKQDPKLIHKEYYGKIRESHLVSNNCVDLIWHYIIDVGGDVNKSFEVDENEIFARNTQELSAYSIEELQNEIDRRRPCCEECKYFNGNKPCNHDTGIGRPIEECFKKRF